MNNSYTVLVTLASNREIIDTQPFISDDQYQKMLVEAKKKNCTVKMMSAGEAKRHRDYKLPVEY